MSQKITPFLWFDHHTEEAIKLYTSLFPNSSITSTQRLPDEKHLTASFKLGSDHFMAIDGGPLFKFSPAISLFVSVDSADLDSVWKNLLDSGTALMPLQQYPFSEKYGWVCDRYGVNWQIFSSPRRRIATALMFTDGRGDEAITFYTTLFPESRIEYINRHVPPAVNGGTVKHAAVHLSGLELRVMDIESLPPPEHAFSFNESISFLIDCKNQEEVDFYWGKLSAVPSAEQCGWLKDKFGISWQVVPSIVKQLMSDPDTAKSSRVMEALRGMKKIDIEGLQRAYNG
jgi:predicted 3-demethylubiquinone-9 3-methyltransferase (glyoxalase superfamily)